MYLVLSLGVLAFLFSLVLTPIVRNLCTRFNLVDHPDSSRKRHTRPIPRVGGIAIVLSYIGSFAVCLILPFNYTGDLRMVASELGKLFCVCGLVFLTGLVDDVFGLRPSQKLAGQVWAAVLAYSAGVQIHVFPGSHYQILWNLPLSVLWLIGCTNAFNLIDGLDGLAAGVGFFATITMLLAAFANQNLHLALLTMPLAGCLLAFLRYNFNPASVFLGDCGSLVIGFLLGCYGVLWGQKSATLLGMTAPMMAVAIPLLDTGLSVFRRFLRHQPIFGADRNHVHHVLLDRGLSPKSVAILMYAVSSAAAVFSLVQNALHNEFGGLIVVLFCVAAWIGVQHLGYVEFALARRMFVKGEFRRLIDSETRLRKFRSDLIKAGDLVECWKVLLNGSRDFGFSAVHFKMGCRLFEHEEEMYSDGQYWQIRVPLSKGEWVNFKHKLREDLNPIILADFVQIVADCLASKTTDLEVVQILETSLLDQAAAATTAD